MRLAHALATLAVAACLSAVAAVPTNMSYQGYLTSGGVPVNTTVSMALKLYDAPTGGNLIWTETQSVSVANGVYNVVLGNTNPLDQTILNGPRYLTVAVGGDADMSPRTPLASAPYAILAKAIDGTIDSSQISGTVAVGNGGTGLSTAATGGLLYGNGTSAMGVTSAGSVGQVLTATASGLPQWSNSSTPNLLISHPGPGSLSIQSAGIGVSIQGAAFDNTGINLPSARTLSVGGQQVVGDRQAAVVSVTNATGIDVADAGPTQVVTVTEYNALVARFNELLDRLRNHGLIQP